MERIGFIRDYKGIAIKKKFFRNESEFRKHNPAYMYKTLY